MYSSHQFFPLDFIQKYMGHIHQILKHYYEQSRIYMNKVDDNVSESR